MNPEISGYVIPLDSIDLANKCVLDELEILRGDYFPVETLDLFLQKHIYPTSQMMFMLQNRCLFNGLARMLVSDELIRFVGEHLNNFTLYHSAWLRVHHPESFSNGIEKVDDITATPLHYDNYNQNTRTTWIPLQDINESTGSLCFTSNKDLIRLTGNGIDPHELHNSEIPNVREYVKLLRTHLSTVECKKGQVVLFDKNLLHGATYSKSNMRITVDLRWVEQTDRNKDSASIMSNLKATENNITALYLYKDYKFIYRHTLKFQYLPLHIKMQFRRLPLLLSINRFLQRIKSKIYR